MLNLYNLYPLYEQGTQLLKQKNQVKYGDLKRLYYICDENSFDYTQTTLKFRKHDEL